MEIADDIMLMLVSCEKDNSYPYGDVVRTMYALKVSFLMVELSLALCIKAFIP